MPAFKVPKQEWLAAEEYFKAHPKAVKLERTVDNKGQPRKNKKGRPRISKSDYKGPALRHSFHAVRAGKGNLQIYAISNRDLPYLGQGSYGKVKQAQNKQGDIFAFKIEGEVVEDSRLHELKIMHELRLLEATNVISFGKDADKEWYFEPENNEPPIMALVDEKNYTIQKLIEGIDLSAYIFLYNPDEKAKLAGKRPLTNTQKLITALKICEAVQALHDKGILHNDLSTSNIKVHVVGNDIKINLCDYAMAVKLKPGETFHSDPYGNVSSHPAPEIAKGYDNKAEKPWENYLDGPDHPAIYSPASDAFSVAAIFTKEFNILKACAEDVKLSNILQQMAAADRKQRPSLKQLHKVLEDILLKQPAYKNAATKPIAMQPKVVVPKVPQTSVKLAMAAPTAVKPAIVKPAAVKPAAVKPAAVKPAAVKPAAVKPAAVKPAAVKPAAVKPAVVKPVAIKPDYRGAIKPKAANKPAIKAGAKSVKPHMPQVKNLKAQFEQRINQAEQNKNIKRPKP
jgi:serine/threonine protein kinase